MCRRKKKKSQVIHSKTNVYKRALDGKLEEKFLLEEYKLLNNLVIQESHILWTRFNVLFAIDIFLFSVCAFLIKGLIDIVAWNLKVIFFIIIISSCVLGLIFTIIWFIITERGVAFKKFWSERSRMIERTISTEYMSDKNTPFFAPIMRTHFYSFELHKLQDSETNVLPYHKEEMGRLNSELSWFQKWSISTVISTIPICFLSLWVLIFSLAICLITNSDFTKLYVIIVPLVVPIIILGGFILKRLIIKK